MADQNRTVRVSGLPTDIEKDRLTDKLFIHFLRTSNGGGEIESISIVKATPSLALITFEERKVAQSVLQYGRHIFKVDGKKYELHLREHRKDLDPNKVVLDMSVTVDYGQLPQGKMVVTHMHTSHPNVQISYSPPEELCTLRGLYSEVQAAVAQLLGHAGARGSRDPCSAASHGPGEGRVSPLEGRTSLSGETTELGSREEQRRRTDQAPALLSEPPGFSPHEDVGSDGCDDWELVGQTEQGAGGPRPKDQNRADEDSSLIMEADMFFYLRRHCGEEYQHILCVYGVEVVDVTSEGLTTLFLSCGEGAFEAGGERERLSGARRDLSHLYQENEARLRKAQLPKSILSPRGGLPRAIEALQVRLPKLLLSEDDNHIYIVGGSSDVSDAKQFLLLGQSEHEEVAENVASLLRSSAAISESPNLRKEDRVNPPLSSAGVMDHKMDKMLKSLESERKAEGARGYKLAARFKDLGVGGLGTRAGGTVAAGSLSPSSRPGLGPMLGHERLSGSEKTGLGGGGSSRVATRNIGEDILVRNGSPLFNPLTTDRKNLLSSLSVGSGQGAEEVAPFAATQNNFLDVTTFPLPGSGSSLRRTSSFSGRSRPKAPDTGRSKTAEEAGRSTTRPLARSSSFGNHSDRRSVHTAEMTVSTVMWRYIKEVFALRLRGITLELQMEDNQSEGSSEITVTVSGGGPSAVSACLAELRKLVATVAADFCVQELRLAELGVANPADETLKECCTEIRSQFKTVSLQAMSESVFLIGPQQLCSQVRAALREVFSGVDGQADPSAPSTSRLNQPVPLQEDGAPNPTLSPSNSPNLWGDPRDGAGGAAGDSQERKNVQRRDSRKRHRNTEPEVKMGVVSQSSSETDSEMKEKAGRGGTVGLDACKTDTLTSHSAKGTGKGDSPVNGSELPSGPVSSHASPHTPTPPKDINLQSGGSQTEHRLSRTGTHEGSGAPLPRHGPQRSSLTRPQGWICVCGETGALLRKTGCGLTLCPQCLLKVHVHCRVCPKAEKVPRGIQGRMSVSEMSLSLPGHGRDATVKITYSIPDGIQGDGHPSPGSTFQGGVFEAYLPLCESMRSLLPRLERAFRSGLTFTVVNGQAGAKVAWDCIPHKTSLQGGKSGNGYPDSNYLTRLSEALTAVGIEPEPAKCRSTNKI